MESTSYLSKNLTTLSSTLNSIATLHSEFNVTDSKSDLSPFTAAILNSYNLDITCFIRDAEQLEQNLFWIPPRPGTTAIAGAGVDADDSSNKTPDNNQTTTDEDPDLGANILMPRNPQRVQPIPPTPLRHANANRAGGLRNPNTNLPEGYSARTLLLAAQKLVDNYIPTPRARKHIKQLLRRQTELQSSYSKLDRHAVALEEAISRGGRAPSDGTSIHVGQSKILSARGKDGGKEEVERLDKLKEELQKEEMEVMALEEMEKELQKEIRKNKALATASSFGSSSTVAAKPSSAGKRSASGRPSARASAGSRPSVEVKPSSSTPGPRKSSSSPSSNVKRVSSGSVSTPRSNVSGSTGSASEARTSTNVNETTPKKIVSQARSDVSSPEEAKVSGHSSRNNQTGPAATEISPVTESVTGESADVPSSEQQEEAEEEPTVRLAAGSSQEDEVQESADLTQGAPPEQPQRAEPVDQYTSPYLLPVPKPTDELERIVEMIWDMFGDVLRSSSLPNSSNKELAGFTETLKMIDSLANPPSFNSTAEDVSMSEDGTVITSSSTSTTSSAASANAPPASYTPSNMILCLQLSYMLRTEEPHLVEFNFLRDLSGLWWNREGREIYEKAYPPSVREDDVDLNEDEFLRGKKVVYLMAGKKLAEPTRIGGRHLVRFMSGLE